MTVQQLRSHFRRGQAIKYAWPGGYPLFFLCSDGGTLCPTCATKERKQLFRSTHEQSHDGWRIDAVDVNWESLIFCDHCGNPIESAYDPTDAN